MQQNSEDFRESQSDRRWGAEAQRQSANHGTDLRWKNRRSLRGCNVILKLSQGEKNSKYLAT